MTRASLLHILNHVGGISEAEVRELEQLAAAFPYCQTAHLLLAKAAHDQGSMLASQRLRRAATYAVDRQMLRQLLEQPASAPVFTTMPAPPQLAAPMEEASPATVPSGGSSTAFFQALVTEDVQPMETQPDEEVATAVQVEEELPEIQPSSLPDAVTVPELAVEPNSDAQTTEALLLELESQKSLEEPVIGVDEELPPASETPAEPVEEIISLPAEEQEESAVGVEEVVSGVDEQPNTLEGLDDIAADSDDDVLPAVAPPIRPPVDAGNSRFEFGLSEPENQLVPILYQLPGLEVDETAEDAAGQPQQSVATETALAPPFRADTDLAYSLLPEGSRFGYALQLRDEELTQPLPATDFFPPDALLHAHGTYQRTTLAPSASSLDLINRFLKVQPRLKSPGVLPAVQEQTDLSARSTHAAPTLASESLAKILVKQGKKDRAIEIYEQLMVRQPEKSAYFADQIQQLKTTE